MSSPPAQEPDLLERALATLPHGPEFRFIDRLIALDPGRSAQAIYTVKPESGFLRGHFPGQPLMPGVLMMEACAQLAGIVAQTDPEIPPCPTLKLTAIRAAKITGSALPGETLQLEARLQQRLGGLVQAETTAAVNGRVVLTAIIALSGPG